MLEFFDGTIDFITDTFDHLYHAWIHCNILVNYWILNYVYESIFNSL